VDPDEDFLIAAREYLGRQRYSVDTLLHTKKDPEEAVLERLTNDFFDIVVINLDQQDPVDFGQIVTRIRSIPTSIPPMIIGVTFQPEIGNKQLAFDAGVDDLLVRPFSLVELGLHARVMVRHQRFKRQLHETTSQLANLNSKLTSSNRSLEELTVTDDLTGLNNMRFMTQYLDKQFEVYARYERPLSIMMIDLDHFKQVNDQHDHLTGSEMIQRVGRIIKENTRSSDIKARYGGDEYIIAMPETTEDSARLVGERIRQAVEGFGLVAQLGNKEVRVTASIGIGTFSKTRHKSYKDLVRDADQALYRAKHQGRNQVVVFSGPVTEGYDSTQSSVLASIQKNES
jgi:diguanylate cyclase (GGDEF)-like protein